jgi:hypothetical protein
MVLFISKARGTGFTQKHGISSASVLQLLTLWFRVVDSFDTPMATSS